ncbi:MAG: HAMP domain-containing protein [Planctomycetes bacterium]|nr:HAMP domain-containing protein [Planctomycetota bacterium]
MTWPALSFRSKILLALAATVGLVLAATTLVVRLETEHQTEEVLDRLGRQSLMTLNRVRDFRREQLAPLRRRLGDNPRVAGALQEALHSGDPSVLAQAADYELRLSEIQGALVAFTDADGALLTALAEGQVLPVDRTVPVDRLVQALLDDDEASVVSGYRRLGDRLYDVDVSPVFLGDEFLGTMALGFPVDSALARQVGELVGAEVAVVADGRCSADTLEPGEVAFRQRLVDSTQEGARRVGVEWEGTRWAFLCEPLDPRVEGECWRVVALRLDPYLAPFDRIRRVALAGGGAALLVALLLGLVLSRGIARPVGQLVEATRRIAGGDYAVRVERRSRDEMGTLAVAFNAMAEGLALKEKYRGVLDKAVSREIADEMLRGEVSLGGENREVTMLFADVRGFTTLTEGMAPQEVIAMLNEYMERASTAVEAAGGVVDKYVGDEIMAIFGAPVAHADDPVRAVRAALAMRDAIRALGDERLARGKPPVRIGVGVHTGEVVAGNMGSARRLNYTVLGEAVNLAARLCGKAEAFQVLISETTRERLGEAFRLTALEPLRVKGLSYPIQVYQVDAQEPLPISSTRRPSGAEGAVVLAAALLLPLGAVRAEEGRPLPTLEELGAGYASEDGTLQLDLSGRLTQELHLLAEAPPWLFEEGGSHLYTGRASLFADLYAGEQFYGLMELRQDRGEAPADRRPVGRIEQGLLRWSPGWTPLDGMQLGKFATPFGGYVSRHDSVADPLIRPPLPYDYRTLICPTGLPTGPSEFLSWKFTPERFRSKGAPPVWGVPYQAGAMAFGGAGPAQWSLAVLNSAPSSEPWRWDPDPGDHSGPSYVGRVSWRFHPALAAGASYDIGPYLDEVVRPALPAGRGLDEFDQELWGLDLDYALGAWAVRGELLRDRWEVPWVSEDVRETSGFLELAWKAAPGLVLAARPGVIHFHRLAASAGGRHRWDFDVARLQVGLAWRPAPGLELKLEEQWNRQAGPTDPDDDVTSVQLALEF